MNVLRPAARPPHLSRVMLAATALGLAFPAIGMITYWIFGVFLSIHSVDWTWWLMMVWPSVLALMAVPPPGVEAAGYFLLICAQNVVLYLLLALGVWLGLRFSRLLLVLPVGAVLAWWVYLAGH